MRKLYKSIVGVMIIGSIGGFMLFEILNADVVRSEEPSIKQQILNNVNNTVPGLQNNINSTKDINNGGDFDDGD